MNTILVVLVVVGALAGGMLVYRHKAEAPMPITPAPAVTGDQVAPGSVATDSPMPKAPITPLTASSVMPVKDGRTLYEGYVDIMPVELVTLETQLQSQGCFDGTTNANWPTNACVYKRVNPPAGFPKGLEIFPHGAGFGPVSFYLTSSRLSLTKDISGVPDMEKFKQAVRNDIEYIKNIVTAKEDTWTLTRNEYPWTAVY
jgi:hypothetical protein